jgi:hypothetical protein
MGKGTERDMMLGASYGFMLAGIVLLFIVDHRIALGVLLMIFGALCRGKVEDTDKDEQNEVGASDNEGR